MSHQKPRSTLFPYTTLFRSNIEPENVEPVYIEKKGWNTDLTKMTTYDELPQELKDYVAFIESEDRKSTRLNSSHVRISYAVFCLKKKIFVIKTTQKFNFLYY